MPLTIGCRWVKNTTGSIMSDTHLITSPSTSPFLNELRWLESRDGDESALRDSKVRWPCQIQSSVSGELYQNRGTMLSFAAAGRCTIILKAQHLLYWDQEHCQSRINLEMLRWKNKKRINLRQCIVFCFLFSIFEKKQNIKKPNIYYLERVLPKPSSRSNDVGTDPCSLLCSWAKFSFN